MKKIILSLVSLVLIATISCKQEQTTKQYFEESPEIEVCKKAVKAFQQGDAETYRSCYSDTVRIWHNQYWARYPGITIDEQMELLKTVLATQEYYRHEGEIWEMIIQDSGQNWVHCWAEAHTKLKGDDEKIEFVIHIAFSVVDNKIVYETLIYDYLPIYLAEQRVQKKSN